MANQNPKMQESLDLSKQLALMKGENLTLKSQLKNIAASDKVTQEISNDEIKSEIMQYKRDNANLNLSLEKKSIQITELEKDIIVDKVDLVKNEINTIESKQTIISLRNENEHLIKEIQKTKDLLDTSQREKGNNRFCLNIEGQPPMSVLMNQLESEVQRLNSKLSGLPNINLEVNSICYTFLISYFR